jgi:DNA repair protein RecN (Recombination protein N)
MLQHLSIKNYAIIDSLEINFKKGFSVITGETGSGKSIILGALQLIMGQRADSKSICNTASKCIIEGSFEIQNYNLLEFFTLHDLDYDPLHTIVRREIHSNGKSRAFINDCPVRLDQLKEFGTHIVDIHSQHQTLALHKSNYQLQLIDSLAIVSVNSHKSTLENYQQNFKKFTNLKNELNLFLNTGEESKSQLDYLAFLLVELKDANLKLGEKEVLESNLKVTENREVVSNTLQKVNFIIEANHQSSPVNSQLFDLLQDLHKISSFDNKYSELADRLNSITIELTDLSKESEILLSKIENEDQNIEEIGERLNLINQLELKHRVIDFNALIEKQNELEEKVSNLSNVEEHITNLEDEIKSIESMLNKEAILINKNRLSVSSQIETFIIHTIKELGIKNGQFKVGIKPQEKLNEWGKDEVCFMFSANQGIALQEMSKVASGGETSRLMLAIKALLAKHLELPCLILDEIDTGVSGEVAGKIAKILAEMATELQLIVISHLPQVAAKANYHYKVEKVDSDGKSYTSIHELNENDRLDELAKMLSGEVISQAAMENAKALIANH